MGEKGVKILWEVSEHLHQIVFQMSPHVPPFEMVDDTNKQVQVQ